VIQRIPITDREQWLALRRQDVTASVVAACFGAHQYTSLRKLYVEKAGDYAEKIDSAILRRGRLLESAVATAVEEDHPQWKLRKATEYYRDPEIRLGATPDFFVDNDPRGLGVIQAKTVAPSAFKKSWTEEGPPFWIAVQTICEMMLTGATWGAVAALVVDPFRMECKLYPVPRHAGMEARIRAAVTEFWANVDAGFEPDFDFAKDADLIASLYPETVPLKSIDLSGNNHIRELLDDYARLSAVIKGADAELDVVKADLKSLMGDAEIATLDGATITFKNQERAKMVADLTQPKSRFRVLKITDHREKETASVGDKF
jgi:predicted phage-related endonuclease